MDSLVDLAFEVDYDIVRYCWVTTWHRTSTQQVKRRNSRRDVFSVDFQTQHTCWCLRLVWFIHYITCAIHMVWSRKPMTSL